MNNSFSLNIQMEITCTTRRVQLALINLHCTPSNYRQTSNIKLILVANGIVDHSDVVGALLVGVAPTSSSFATENLASMGQTETTTRLGEKYLSDGIWCVLYKRFDGSTTNKWTIPLTYSPSTHAMYCCYSGTKPLVETLGGVMAIAQLAR